VFYRLAFILLVAMPPMGAQARFDVASIRVNTSGVGAGLSRTPGGLTATNADLATFVAMALQTTQIDWSHVPESLRFARYDIVAKSSGKLSGDQYWEMCQTLLEERFKLKFHRIMKDSPVFALVFSKNGAVGPKLTRSQDPDCPANPSLNNFCGVRGGFGVMLGQRVPMARITRELTPIAGRPVQDRTGLTGVFDFELKWAPEQLEPKSEADGIKLNGAVISGPPFATALEEQLGLKLRAEKGQIELLVIDQLEKPTEN
jgi:uncharacterized protein (TIGR03435 family)